MPTPQELEPYRLNNTSPSSDDANARYLARACALAYLPSEQARPSFRAELDLDAELISVENSQVYVGVNPDAIVVAFRGSEEPTTMDGLKDWLLTNANNFLVLPQGRAGTDFAAAGVGARFHRGFLEALDHVWSGLFKAVDAHYRKQERPVWLTGHSLGGSLALLASWRFHRNFIPVHQVYTFGAPMVGNDAAAKAFEKELGGRIFRYVDPPDPVPLLPTMSLIANAYVHCLEEVGLETPEAAQSAMALLKKDAAASNPDGSIGEALMSSVWGNVMSRIDAHMIANYLSKLPRKRGT